MKTRKWILAVDIFWAIVLLFALVAWLSGKLPWYRAAFPCAPFAIYLVTRGIVLRGGQHPSRTQGPVRR